MDSALNSRGRRCMGNPSQQHRGGSPAAPLTRDVCAIYIDRGRAKLEENEEVKVTRPLFWPRVSRRRGSLTLLGALPAAHGGLGVRPTRRRRIGVLSWAQVIARMWRTSVRRHRRAHDVPCDDGKELESSIYFRSGRRCSRPWLSIKPPLNWLCDSDSEPGRC